MKTFEVQRGVECTKKKIIRRKTCYARIAVCYKRTWKRKNAACTELWG